MVEPTVDAASAIQILSVSVSSRIAPFWRELPKNWFAQFEAIVGPQKLSKEAKYDLVISKLARDDLTLVSDILESNDRDYEVLKNRLLSCLQASSDEQFDRLMQESQMGEQRPSQFFRRMAELGKSAGVESPTIKKLWLRRLPGHIRNALVAHEEKSTEELCSLADKLVQNSRASTIEEIAEGKQEQSGVKQELQNLTQKFGQLCEEINSIRERQGAAQQFARGNWTRRQESFASGSNQAPRNRSLCMYHQRFGRFARNCQQPCSWQNRTVPRPSAPQQQGGSSWRSRQGN